MPAPNKTKPLRNDQRSYLIQDKIGRRLVNIGCTEIDLPTIMRSLYPDASYGADGSIVTILNDESTKDKADPITPPDKVRGYIKLGGVEYAFRFLGGRRATIEAATVAVGTAPLKKWFFGARVPNRAIENWRRKPD